MSWVTTLYAMLIGASATIALPNFLVGIWQRRGAQLFFVGVAIGTIGLAAGELAMMHATSVEQYAAALRWMHLPIFVGIISIVGFVQLYFGTGRLWLGLMVCGLRLVCLIINFISPLNLNFRAITGLTHIPLLGEMVSTARGLASPWNYLSQVTSLLLIVFVVDASISLWRKGEPRDRRRARSVGGSIVLFITLSAMSAALFYLKIVPAPYFLSVWFFLIVCAMALDLAYDLFVAGQVVQKLQASEASLLESEARFQTMADAAPILMWMSGPDKLCTFFNQGWLDFTGRTMEQELGDAWAEGVHPEDFDHCLMTYQTAFDAREPFLLEYRLRRHDGEYRWLTDHGVPRHDAAGNFLGYIGACVDTTELRQKEEAIRESEERMSLAMEAAKLGLWEWDVSKDELWGTEARRALLGLSEKITLEDALSTVHVDDRDRIRQTLKDAVRTGRDYQCEYRVVLPDGTVRRTEHRGQCVKGADGKVLILRGVSIDVTEREQAEELFGLVTEASPSGILVVNDEGRIVLVNAHIEELFGYKRDELIGKPVEILVPARFAGKHPAYRKEFLSRPEARPMGAGRELFGCRKDGSEFPVEIGLTPIRAPQGLLILAAVVDISKRKQAEEEARSRREQIELLSRVSLLGEMTGSLAHELNQPLAAIASNANAAMRFIDKEKIDPQNLREILVDIVSDGHRAHEIIHNVRNTIKKGAAIRQKMNLNEIILHVAHLVQPDAWANSCKIKTTLDKNLPATEGDPVQIQQVLINLVNNAFQAMRDMPVSQREVEVSTQRNGNNEIIISVRDHGVGMTDDVKDRLFEQFFTTKEEGLGMGLAIVRSIIEAHAGHIRAENADGGGAFFSFTLPAVN